MGDISEENAFNCSMSSVKAVDRFHDLVLTVETSNLGGSERLADHDLLVLTSGEKSARNLEIHRDLSRAYTTTAKPVVIYGKVQGVSGRSSDVITVIVRVNIEMRQNIVTILRVGTHWTALKLNSLSTINREYQALHGLPFYNLRKTILNSAKVKKPDRQLSKTQVPAFEKVFRLNQPQAAAVATVLKQKEGFILIQGPPGTVIYTFT